MKFPVFVELPLDHFDMKLIPLDNKIYVGRPHLRRDIAVVRFYNAEHKIVIIAWFGVDGCNVIDGPVDFATEKIFRQAAEVEFAKATPLVLQAKLFFNTLDLCS